MLKIVITSDTHNMNLPQAPEGDVLIHCGDATNYGSPAEFHKFGEWLSKQPHKHKIVVHGNHDLEAETAPRATADTLRLANPNLHILQDSGVTIEGVRFWGSPYTPLFGDWAFMKPDNRLEAHWDAIADDTHVLITHGPSAGRLDANRFGHGCGSKSLAAIVAKLPDLALHAFGHIHESAGVENSVYGDMVYANCAYAGTGKFYVFTVDNGPVVRVVHHEAR